MSTITSINPATEEELQTYDLLDEQEVSDLIERAERVRADFYEETDFSDRAKRMKKAAEELENRKEHYAGLMVSEMGKPITEALSEIEKCAWVCRYYADHAEEFLADEVIETDADRSFVAHEPLGVVLAVMPWNFPYWQVFRFAAPALMAGNAGLLKHASNVPGCALAIQEIFERAGFPEGLFTTLLIDSDAVEKILENDLVRAATLTGSGPAGSAVAATAGKNIKKTVLELGGSDAYLVLEDADLEQAAEACCTSRLINTGQSCIGAKRFIVLEEVYDEWLELFTEKMKAANMGDPTDEDTDLGSMARKDLRDDLHEQVQKSIEQGATCTLGGEIPDRTGAFYPATILTDVQPGMPAFDEELFGPVAAVIKAKDEQEAIELANNSDFGLGAAVFTKDLERGEHIARKELQAGCCFVNAFVRSDPRLPFGGIKTSGYGRELSHHGIREFVNVKTIYIVE